MVQSIDNSKASRTHTVHLRIGLRTPDSAGWAARERDDGSYGMLFLRANRRSGNAPY